MTTPADTDALMALLRESADMLSESQSGYIPGCGADEKWDKRRDALVTEINEALTAAQQSCTPCCGKFSACSQPCSPRADYWQEKATLCDEFAAQQKVQEDEWVKCSGEKGARRSATYIPEDQLHKHICTERNGVWYSRRPLPPLPKE